MVCECPSIRNVSATETLLLLPECFLGLIKRINSSNRWRVASLKRHYLVASVVRVQSKKSEDLNAVGPPDPISVNICVKPITGSYLQLPNALSVAAHLGTILGLIGLAKWSPLNGVSVSSDVPFWQCAGLGAGLSTGFFWNDSRHSRTR